MRLILSFVFLLVSAGVVRAQIVSGIGSDATFDVATWNIEMFGGAGGPLNNERQLNHAVAVVQQSGVDLWALQEIDNPAYFDSLLARLGADWNGNLSESTNLRMAFLYRTDAVSVRRVRTILSPENDVAFAYRPPLQLEADILVGGGRERVTFVVLHMKARSDFDSWSRRRDAATALKNRIDGLHRSDPFVILGDFNDELRGSITSGQDSPYADFFADSLGLPGDPSYYRFLSAGMEARGVGTYCGNSSTCSTGSTIDHILVTDELVADAEPAFRFGALLQDLASYVFSTSDHLPVVARFRFADGTAVEPPPVETAFQVYPLPAGDRLHVGGAHGTVHLVDMLGRTVWSGAAGGASTFSVDLTSMPAGIYVLRDAAGRSRLVPVRR